MGCWRCNLDKLPLACKAFPTVLSFGLPLFSFFGSYPAVLRDEIPEGSGPESWWDPAQVRLGFARPALSLLLSSAFQFSSMLAKHLWSHRKIAGPWPGVQEL